MQLPSTTHPPTRDSQVQTTSKARHQYGLPGPKSGLRLLLLLIYSHTPTGGVRVPVPAGTGGPKPIGHINPHEMGKHAPGGTTASVSSAVRVMEATGFKRSFRRAQNRCARHPQQHTRYKGRQIPGSQMGLHTAADDNHPKVSKRRPACKHRGGQTPRLKIL